MPTCTSFPPCDWVGLVPDIKKMVITGVIWGRGRGVHPPPPLFSQSHHAMETEVYLWLDQCHPPTNQYQSSSKLKAWRVDWGGGRAL